VSQCDSRRILAIAAVLSLAAIGFAAGPTFRPDVVVRGSSLAGWHTLGQASWKLDNGVLTGSANPGSDGGWLVLDKSFQDVGFFASFRCPAGCKTGILLRAEKTPEGMKGIFVSLSEDDQSSYRVALDDQGRELRREKIMAPTPGPGTASGRGGALGATPGAGRYVPEQPAPLPAGVSLPELERPVGEYKPGQWNTVDITLAWDTVAPKFNGGRLGAGMGGKVEDADGKYGPIALYAGGTAEVRYQNIAYKDLNARQFPREQVSHNFRMQRLSEWYYSYAAAAADLNHDGIMDVIAGPYYYLGPNYTVAKELYKAETFNPGTEWPIPSMTQIAYDWEGNGWPDVLMLSGNAGMGVGTLLVNPKGESRRWDKHVVLPAVGNETTGFADIDGDGKPELIHAYQSKYLAYSKPDPSDVTKPWITTVISGPGPWGINIGHGLGVGDINGDGLMDFVTCYGWWEQPAKGSGQKLWTYHPEAFGRWGASQGGPGGALIGIYDVNGDGLMDVVTSLEGHGFGLAWFEQKRDGGKISFVEHKIMDGFTDKNAGNVTFTEPHATAFADFDGDGIPDVICAKSAEHHHGYTDPDPYGPPVLYLYRTVRNPKAPGGAEFVPELIHNRSGVGDHFWVGDLNHDGMPDIVTSGAMGTFIFFNNMKKPGQTATAQK
jgi:Domain of Unknown Function (DUF1080)/FG-GAP-like repeat